METDKRGIMNKITISIAKDFSEYPAGRYRDDGEYNGTTFREKSLVPVLRDDKQVEVIFDGVAGFGSSFLEEAFGGLIRDAGMTKEFLDTHLLLTTTEPELEDFVKLAQRYIDEASRGK
jgi:hypothetical protein